MISYAMWCKKSTSKLFKENEIARKIMLFLANNVHKKTPQKVKTGEILKACAHHL